MREHLSLVKESLAVDGFEKDIPPCELTTEKTRETNRIDDQSAQKNQIFTSDREESERSAEQRKAMVQVKL